MIGGHNMIPNPKKTFTINADINKAMEIFNNFLPLVNSVKKGYQLTEKDELMNSFTFERTEFLSLGVFIDVQLTEVGDKTQVDIEVRRKLGAFDQWHEVQLAGEHIKNFSKAISKGMNPDTLEKSKSLQKKTVTPQVEKKEGISTFKLVMFCLLGLMFLGLVM